MLPYSPKTVSGKRAPVVVTLDKLPSHRIHRRRAEAAEDVTLQGVCWHRCRRHDRQRDPDPFLSKKKKSLSCKIGPPRLPPK